MINPKITEIASNTSVPIEKILKVCFALSIYDEVPNMLMEYFDSGEILHEEIEHIYRINLFDYDGEKYSLKFPLFVNDTPTGKRFDEFWKMLLRRGNPYGLNSKGHISNERTYSPISKTPEVIERFNNLDLHNDLDLDKVCKTIAKYYQTADPPKGLGRYLTENFEDDYANYEEVTYSKMI